MPSGAGKITGLKCNRALNEKQPLLRNMYRCYSFLRQRGQVSLFRVRPAAETAHWAGSHVAGTQTQQPAHWHGSATGAITRTFTFIVCTRRLVLQY